MEKPASGTQKKRKRSGPSPALWITLVFLATVVISAGFTHASGVLLDGSGIYAALAVLLLIILIGIAFDILGVAVTAAPDQPLHSMAARKVRGAKEAIGLIKNADRVASICNDVIGDICGVVSGSAAAVIAVRLLEDFTFSWPNVLKVGMSALVAGLTVGGKAIGKGVALHRSVPIVHFAGRVISAFHRPFIGGKKQRKTSR